VLIEELHRIGEGVRLDFGYSDKLRKIVAVSKSLNNDPFSTAVLHRYDELKQLLEGKYGSGKVQAAATQDAARHADPATLHQVSGQRSSLRYGRGDCAPFNAGQA